MKPKKESTYTLLENILRAGYEPGNGTEDGAQIVAGMWWRPTHGIQSLSSTLMVCWDFFDINAARPLAKMKADRKANK